jgi:hypothetical protein
LKLFISIDSGNLDPKMLNGARKNLSNLVLDFVIYL